MLPQQQEEFAWFVSIVERLCLLLYRGVPAGEIVDDKNDMLPLFMARDMAEVVDVLVQLETH